MIIKMPFMRGFFGHPLMIKFKNVEFNFNVKSVMGAADRLECEFSEITKKSQYELQLALVYEAYIEACRDKRKKVKYTFNHAVYWMENMQVSSAKQIGVAMGELFGSAKGGKEVKKK